MDGLEKIKNKIIKDAESEAKKIVDDAKKNAEEITSANKKEASEMKKRLEAELNAEIKLYTDKNLAQARLDAKKEYLEKRENIIQDFIDSCMSKLSHDSEDYKKCLKNILKNNMKSLSGEIKVKCNKADVKTLKSLFRELNFYKYKIEEEEILGIILEDSTGRKIEETMNSRLDRMKQELRQMIVKELD